MPADPPSRHGATDADVAAFLERAGKSDVWAYYGVARDAPAEVIDAALRKRRAWAQGQQANPRFRDEALFLIRHNSALRGLVLAGAESAPPPPPAAPAEPVPDDPYAVIGAPPDASPEALQIAFRDRQRFLRVTAGPEAYQALERAWAIVGDPERRAAFDRGEDTTTAEPLPEGAATPLPEPIPDNTTRIFTFPPQVEPPPVQAAPALPPPRLPERTTAPPRLAVDCPAEVRIALGKHPHRFRVAVRNVGGGHMGGHFTADRPWLDVATPELDGELTGQVRVVVVDPARVPRGDQAGTLSVVTQHGERVDITVLVQRAPRLGWLPWLAFGLGAAGVFGLGFWWVVTRTPPPMVRFEVEVEPPASHIYIDGREVGAGRSLSVPVARSSTHRLRVEAEGYAAYDELVQNVEGDRLHRSITLHRGPREEQSSRELAEGELAAHERDFLPCFQDAGAPGVVQFVVVARLEAGGVVADVKVEDATWSSPTVLPCVDQVVRRLDFSATRGGLLVKTRFTLAMPEPPP